MPDEQTPLLGDGPERVRKSQDEDHHVDDLGPFKLQPPALYELVSAKDISKLSELGGLDAVIEAVLTDPKRGLTSEQLDPDNSERQYREHVYGKNALPEKEMKSFWTMLYEAFADKVLIILTVAACISFALGLYQDFGPQHDPSEPRVQWVEGVSISGVASKHS